MKMPTLGDLVSVVDQDGTQLTGMVKATDQNRLYPSVRVSLLGRHSTRNSIVLNRPLGFDPTGATPLTWRWPNAADNDSDGELAPSRRMPRSGDLVTIRDQFGRPCRARVGKLGSFTGGSMPSIIPDRLE